MIVHILHMYNSKHPRTWDESLPYVQHSYNQALHSSIGHSPFQVGLGFQPLCPIYWPCHLQLLTQIRLMSSPKQTRQPASLSTSNIFASRSMTFWRNQIPSTSSDMINIGCHTSFRWVTKYGCICKRNALLEPIRNGDHSDMVLTPLIRLWKIMHLSLALPHSLACTQCLMRTTFSHTFHHY